MRFKSYKLALLILAALALVFFSLGATTEEPANTNTEPPIQSGEVTVKMTKDGFIPDKIHVTAGTKVRFVNEDSFWHWPASDIHPSHSIYPEFDPREPIAPQTEWTFVFGKVGVWGMHDHLAPYIEGEITVSPATSP